MEAVGKIIAISGDKQFYKVGVNSDDSVWFTKTSEVETVLAVINRGDEVNLSFEWQEKNRMLTAIEVTKKAVEENQNYNKSESIEKQTMMKAAADAVKAMPGCFANINDLGDSVIKLYNMFYTELKK